MNGGKHYIKVYIDECVGIMLGVAHKYQDKNRRYNEYEPNSFCLLSDGSVCYDGEWHDYTTPFRSGDTVEIVLDMELPSLRFKINGLDKGVAFHGDQLKQGHYFLTVLLLSYGSARSGAVTILKSVHEVNN